MNELEQMRQLLFHMMARVSATEAISRASFAMMCSFDGSPQMKDKLTNGVFPLLLKEAAERHWDASSVELSEWLQKRETEILQEEFRRILEQIDFVRANSKRDLN